MQRGNINKNREQHCFGLFYSKEALLIIFPEYKNIAEGNIKMNLRTCMV